MKEAYSLYKKIFLHVQDMQLKCAHANKAEKEPSDSLISINITLLLVLYEILQNLCLNNMQFNPFVLQPVYAECWLCARHCARRWRAVICHMCVPALVDRTVKWAWQSNQGTAQERMWGCTFDGEFHGTREHLRVGCTLLGGTGKALGNLSWKITFLEKQNSSG